MTETKEVTILGTVFSVVLIGLGRFIAAWRIVSPKTGKMKDICYLERRQYSINVDLKNDLAGLPKNPHLPWIKPLDSDSWLTIYSDDIGPNGVDLNKDRAYRQYQQYLEEINRTERICHTCPYEKDCNEYEDYDNCQFEPRVPNYVPKWEDELNDALNTLIKMYGDNPSIWDIAVDNFGTRRGKLILRDVIALWE